MRIHSGISQVPTLQQLISLATLWLWSQWLWLRCGVPAFSALGGDADLRASVYFVVAWLVFTLHCPFPKQAADELSWSFQT